MLYNCLELPALGQRNEKKAVVGGGINLGGMVETGSERMEEREEGKESDQERKPDISLGEMVETGTNRKEEGDEGKESDKEERKVEEEREKEVREMVETERNKEVREMMEMKRAVVKEVMKIKEERQQPQKVVI